MTSSAQERFRAIEKLPLIRVGNTSVGLVGGFRQIKEVFEHREMLLLLVRRDLQSRYKDSFLGFLWTLVRPITQLLIYYVAVGKFLGAERGIPEFAIYIFSGLTAYGLFSEILLLGTSSVVGNGGLVKKVYLPREVFPIASVGAAIFTFSIQIVVLLAATLLYGHFPLGPELLFAVPAVLIIITWGTALALMLSAMNVFFRDVQYLVEVLLLILLWASPIVYAWKVVRDILHPGIWLNIYTNNPITLSVLGFQRAFWTSGSASAVYPDHLMSSMWIAAGVGVIAIFLCQQVFARLQGNFAQVL